MKRDPFFRDPIGDDLAYMWAAYRMGAIPEAYVPPGLDKEEFTDQMTDLLLSFADVKTMVAPRNGVPSPVGIAVIERGGTRLQPHAVWFPWATIRNKIESAAHYLGEMRRQRRPDGRFYKGLIFAPESTWTFFEHMMRRGILKRCGKVEAWFDDGSPAMLFYTKEPD